ncbi:superoxide dismutase [Candidatus Roizmanbacteria bacterium]|nr:superoxide dismutase [Candidatus Roizmanbacteria bacterium]
MFQVPDLPYQYDALQPVISKKIMELHHDKHHAAYVNNLNKAVTGTEFESMDIEELLKKLDSIPENIRMTVRNNGGGHANHTFFWEIMRSPMQNNQPTGKISQLLTKQFGSFETFKEQFANAGMTRFGSGWAWLVKKHDGALAIYSSPNQDSPLMQGDMPILGVDVWEHAYYLDYLNDRAAYLSKWWDVVNWDEVAKRLT